MGLKDNWQDLQDAIAGDPNSGNEMKAKPINDIAHAVMKLEEKVESGTFVTIDTEMSDTSENAVQNKVIKAYVDESIRTAILDSWEAPV